ncbi:MAG: ribbon-helix-helix domain-containing protein [Bacillota bacterium]
MGRMIRKQIYLHPHQDKALKEMVRARGVSEAEVIREAIEYRLTSGLEPRRDEGAWEAERLFIQGLMQRPLRKARTWRREDLYAGR